MVCIPSHHGKSGQTELSRQCIGVEAVSCVLVNVIEGTGDYEEYEAGHEHAIHADVHCHNSSDIFGRPENDLPSAVTASTILPTCSVEEN